MILPKKIFAKHQNELEFKNLDDSEVLSSEFIVREWTLEMIRNEISNR